MADKNSTLQVAATGSADVSGCSVQNDDERPALQGQSSRIGLFDVLRGFSVLSMVAFHTCYDLRYLAGMYLFFFYPPFQDIWRASISWTFLFIAGCMCSQSRSNLKRSAKYLLVALLIFVVTLMAAVDTPISFGIIFCMGASTLIYALLEVLHVQPSGYCAAAILFFAFICTLQVSSGFIGIGGFQIALPRVLYLSGFLDWLGFSSPTFASGDYYPLIPYTLLYLAGASLGRTWQRSGYPDWARRCHVPFFEYFGRHALPVYVLHQPVILIILMIIGLIH